MNPSRMWLACVALAGCGGASTSSSGAVTAFEQNLAAATQALTSYQVATRNMATAADCSAAVNAYGTPMQGDLDHMMSTSGSMDDQMRSMGQTSRADVGCGVQAMHDELGRHLQVACHGVDMANDRDEAARHIAAMANGLQHMQMRSAELSSGMGPGMMDAGWRMPDGGMMDPDDHPMGCPGGPMMDGGAGPMMDGGVGHMP